MTAFSNCDAFSSCAQDEKSKTPARHPRAYPHEHKTPVTLSRPGDFVFLAPLKYTLSLCHFFLLVFVRKIQKGPTMLGLSIPNSGTRIPPKLYEIFVSKNTQQHAKSSQSERTNCNSSRMHSPMPSLHDCLLTVGKSPIPCLTRFRHAESAHCVLIPISFSTHT